MSTEDRYKSFNEFWPYYVQEHSKSVTQWIHCVGTILAGVTLLFLVRSFVQFGFERTPLIALIIVPVIGYGFAWFSHFFIQKNRPATFKYPLWSFMADFKMAFLLLTGRMQAEVVKAYQKKSP